MLKNLFICLILFTFATLETARSERQNDYISITQKTDRMKEVLEDLQVIQQSLPYLQNKTNDGSNADPDLENKLINAMYDLRTFFSNIDKGDPTFHETFDEIKENLTMAEVKAILRQSGMYEVSINPISGERYQKIEQMPGYKKYDNGKDEKWLRHLAAFMAFQLEVIQYMSNLLDALNNAGVQTYIVESPDHITAKPLSDAAQFAGEEIEDLRKQLENL